MNKAPKDDCMDVLPIKVYNDERALKARERIKEIALKTPVNIIRSKRIDPVDAFLYVPKSTHPQTLTLEKARSK